tara:strand:- start:961 stop:2220 length:1260 start_codon:yes stop_codon:yes gene_type:complete
MTAFHSTDTTVKTCKRCLYRDDHPLGLVIDDDGICSGCRIHEEKDQLDWDHRWHELETLVAPYRSTDTRNYDCIVPVSGAGDSYFIVHTVVNRLKLKPLLVTYNRYYNTPLGIRNLANLRRKFNVDILIQNVNPRSVKSIIRTTLRRFGSFHWPAIAGQTVFPVQTAVSHRIPLIIWGAHQGLEQVGMFSHLHNVEMTRRYRKDHDLMGFEADDLLSIFDNLKEEEVWQYRYPSWDELNDIGVRGIYLGNYMRWDPLAQHQQMVELYNYQSAEQNRTFDVFDHVDDWHYADTHDWIKFEKHGYGKATDHACREIRHGRISRQIGKNLSDHYVQQKPKNIELLLDWLGLNEQSLNYLLKPNAIEEMKVNNIELNTIVDSAPSKTSTGAVIREIFQPNSSLGLDQHTPSPVIIGKGYPDIK